MKFNSLEVKSFRHINEQIIELGTVITAIAGQNGTGKSTLLGWIAQSSDFKEKVKSLSNTTFSSKYNEIFRFCPLQDYTKDYEVILHFSNDDNISENKVMTTRYSESEDRYRVDFDGRGNAINYPILYLGLKRLIPLATEKNITINDENLEKMIKHNTQNLQKRYYF